MFKSIISHCREWVNNICEIVRLSFKSRVELILENIALKSQLALYVNNTKSKKITKPRSTLAFRQLWVLISKISKNWKSYLNIFQPATVVGWHQKAFKFYWRKKSKRIGRPPISNEIIDLIRYFHKGNKLLSPKKIHELIVSLGYNNAPAPNTISKYFPETRKPPTEKQTQSWMTFLKNHMDVTWAVDFFTVPTLKFDILHVIVVIAHETREIVHFAVTRNPNMFWVRQQFRNITPYGKKPKYLIHDNDPVFKSKVFQEFLESSNIKSKATSYRSPWQNPYGERVIGIIRQELLNHIIPFNEKHLEKLLGEYIHNYYNTNRTHQVIDCKTPIRKPTYLPADAKDIKLKATPVLNGLYYTYTRAA